MKISCLNYFKPSFLTLLKMKFLIFAIFVVFWCSDFLPLHSWNVETLTPPIIHMMHVCCCSSKSGNFVILIMIWLGFFRIVPVSVHRDFIILCLYYCWFVVGSCFLSQCILLFFLKIILLFWFLSHILKKKIVFPITNRSV